MPSHAAAEAKQDLVLVVDDDQLIGDIVSSWLEEEGYVVETATSGEKCLAALSTLFPSAVCLDLHLPGLSGIEILQRIQKTHPYLPIMFLTGETDVRTAVSAIQLGAFDYLVKPIDRARLVTQVRNAVDRGRMALQLAQLQREVDGRGFPGLIGESPEMKAMLRQMGQLAACDTTVMIHGESGSGKELVARGIHVTSGRSAEPFVALNCAAIPESLQESELFGHEKGAFTGASHQRQGAFEQADRGTLFLDEVGDLSAGLQAKLLRALQERSFRRIGGRSEVPSDFRLLAATNSDLDAAVADGRFRQDLFFRIAVFELDVPPLRSRREDIPVLARHFVFKYAEHEESEPRLHPSTVEVLQTYHWPGNVRELENAIQHALVVAKDEILPTHLPRRLRAHIGERNGVAAKANVRVASGPDTSNAAQENLNLEEIERRTMVMAIERTGGNLAKAGRLLGLSRSTVYRKLKKYGLVDQYEGGGTG